MGFIKRIFSGPEKVNVDQSLFNDTTTDANKTAAQTQGFLQQQRANQQAGALSGFQGAQAGLVGTLQNQIAGNGPSVAENQLRRGLDQNIDTQMALAGSARGGNLALNQRSLARNVLAAGQQTNADAATLRAGEQLQAQNTLAGVANAGAQTALTAQTQADNLASQYMQMGMSLDQARMAANQRLAELKLNAQGINTNAQAQHDASIIGGGAAVGAAALMGPAALVSDANLKQDIAPSSKDMGAFLDALDAKSYTYKDPTKVGTAPGERFGILAQDLEKSRAGKSIVRDSPEGKSIDVGQGLGLALAALADVNKRLKKVEH